MMQVFSGKQVRGLMVAKQQYDQCRKLGHDRDSALTAATRFYMEITDEPRDKAMAVVEGYIDTQPEIPGGVL